MPAIPRWLRVLGPIVSIVLAVALALAGALSDGGEGGARVRAEPRLADPDPLRDAGPDGALPFDPDGAIPLALGRSPSPVEGPAPTLVDRSEPRGDGDYRCEVPALAIPKRPECARGLPYPACRWQIPRPGEGEPFAIWRNTTHDHRWGRPGLVALILASAADYQRRWPGERLTVGDLDAPGPRHATHEDGVDVDLYLTEAMLARNEGRGSYPDNYEGRPEAEVAGLRARVLDLAKILARCAHGQVRIYYNDPPVIESFRAWFDGEGLESSVGPPMRAHNPLHRFHFHLTVPEDLAPLPIAGE